MGTERLDKNFTRRNTNVRDMKTELVKLGYSLDDMGRISTSRSTGELRQRCHIDNRLEKRGA